MADPTGIFDPDSKTVKEVFGDTKSFYLMPEYQRPYSWDDERVNQLWEDIKTSFENYTESKEAGENPVVDENYFLGSIILTPAKGGFDVVDGQQRLTTLMILFCVIRDLYPKLNETADITVDPEEITIVDINNSISYNNQRNRLRLFTHINNQNDFENEIIKGVKWPVKFTKSEKSTRRYLNTAICFKENIEEFTKGDPNRIIPFINYLFNRVRLITINCSSQSFAIKLFQVLNTRGMDLAPADLIKSFLYGNIVNFEKDPKLVEKERDKLMQEWNKIELRLENTDDSITDLFNVYLYFVSHTNPRKTLYEELQPFLKNQVPTEFIFEFKNFVDHYLEVYNKKDYSTYSFFYLQHQLYWKPILAGAKHINFFEQDHLKEKLSRFYYLYWIGGYTSPKIKQISFNILKWIKGEVDFAESSKDNELSRFVQTTGLTSHLLGTSLQKVSDNTYTLKLSPSDTRLMAAIDFKLEEKLKSDGVFDKVKVNLSENCYNEGWLKPLLIRLEYKQWQSSIDYIPLERNLHIEHIMPVSREYKYWQDLFTKDEHEAFLMKIENLTLLTGDRNISASNRPFNASDPVCNQQEKDMLFDADFQKHVDKLLIYYGKGIDGVSKFLITQHISENYITWTKKEMEERKKWLFKEIETLLKISLS